MKHPNIKTKVVHSYSKNAWNVVGVEYMKKYKIARVPYLQLETKGSEVYNFRKKNEAFEHARFISFCFNNPVIN